MTFLVVGAADSPNFGATAEAALGRRGWQFGTWNTDSSGGPVRFDRAASGGFSITLSENTDRTVLLGATPCLAGKPNAEKTAFPQASTSAG